MQRSLILPVGALLLAVACSGSTEDQLKGTWTIDKAAMMDMDEFKNAPGMPKKMMDAAIDSMTIEITFDNGHLKCEMKVMGRTETIEGNYEVESTDGNKLVLKTVNDKGKEDTVTCWIDGDTLTYEAGDDTFKLKRK
ncbi:MAG: hypothetical protein V3W41_07420 [Planctomycetota bacterium]